MLSPRLFVSYSRRDQAFVDVLVKELQRRGFRVFLDTSDIDPGDNFVARLTKEITRATAIVPVISEHYSVSRWAQAELYHALAQGKTPIPILLSSTMSSLDEPLQRLLRDTQYVTVTGQLSDEKFQERFAEVLSLARTRYRRQLLDKLVLFLFLGGALWLGIWWVVTHLNELDQARRRDSTMKEIVEAKTVLQHERITALASAVTGDRQGLGEIMFLSQDPAKSDITRFNALALGSELRKGQKSSRWYVQGLHIKRTTLDGCAFINTSFIGGVWTEVAFEDCTFSGVFWAAGEKGLSMANARFRNSQFFGGEIESVNADDVDFVNTKFRGATIDTTSFSKVRFSTDTPPVEGNPMITPNYTLFERSVLISRRTPPQKGILDLTMTGDDVVFDNVVFVDCRLEGWFRPEWFRNSSFERCDLPKALTKDSLARTGNTVH